jgi:putative colanic acid biosysnthesis UDP-glucose lipid carrier transferase
MSIVYKILFLITDFLLLNLSIVAAFYFYDSSFWITSKTGLIYLFIFSNLAWLFLILVSTPYNITKTWALSKVLKNQISFISIHLLVVGSLIVFFDHDYNVFQIVLIYIYFTPVFFLYRIGIYYLRKVFAKEPTFRNFILIGRNAASEEIRKFYLIHPDLTYRFKGYIDFDSSSFPIEAVHDFCASTEVHEIYCCVPSVSEKQLQQLVNFGLDSFIKVKLVLDSGSPDKLALQLDQYDKLPGLNIAVIRLDEPVNQFIKRLFDLVFSFLVIISIMTWLVPVMAILIRIDSRGPVFFLQKRSGKDNRPFSFIKFRTMAVNPESDTKQATANDPRVTRLGHFLRKSSLDELPQFINVFLGTMSVVGPRPHMLRHTEEYGKLIETFIGRQYVRPGITGLAQCLGYRGETQNLADMENRVRLDRYYIENWTFWLDIKVIFLTIVSLIRGSEKAY